MRHSTRIAPTIVKTVNQTSLFHIESNLDQLGLLSPTHGQRYQQQSGTNHALTSFEQRAYVIQGHTSCRNKENPNTAETLGEGGLEVVKLARELAFMGLITCTVLGNALRMFPARRSLSALAS